MTKKIHDLIDIWNNPSVTFTAIKMNVDDQDSASDSKLIDLQVGGTSKFSVDKSGNAQATEYNVGGYSSSGFTLKKTGTNVVFRRGDDGVDMAVQSGDNNVGVKIGGYATGTSGALYGLTLGRSAGTWWTSNSLSNTVDSGIGRVSAGVLGVFQGDGATLGILRTTKIDHDSEFRISQSGTDKWRFVDRELYPVDVAGVGASIGRAASPISKLYFGSGNGLLENSGHPAIGGTNGPLYLKGSGVISTGVTSTRLNARYGLGLGDAINPTSSFLPVSDGVASFVGSDGVTLGTLQAAKITNPNGNLGIERAEITPRLATENALIVRGVAGQSAYLQLWRDSSNSTKAWVSNAGDLYANSLTTPANTGGHNIGSLFVGYGGNAEPLLTSNGTSIRLGSNLSLHGANQIEKSASNPNTFYISQSRTGYGTIFRVCPVSNGVYENALVIGTDSSLSGPHIQNVGTTDSPTFGGMVLSGGTSSLSLLASDSFGRSLEVLNSGYQVDIFSDDASQKINIHPFIGLAGLADNAYSVSIDSAASRDPLVIKKQNTAVASVDSYGVASLGGMIATGNVQAQGLRFRDSSGSSVIENITGGNVYLRANVTSDIIIGDSAATSVVIGNTTVPVTLRGDLSGDHLQNLGTTDSPTFARVNYGSTANFIEASSGNLRLWSGDGSLAWQGGSVSNTFYKNINTTTVTLSGDHIQNLGATDSPTFDGALLTDNLELDHDSYAGIEFGGAGYMRHLNYNAISLSKNGRQGSISFDTQNANLTVFANTQTRVSLESVNQRLRTYDVGRIGFTEHVSSTNNDGNMITWSNGTASNGQRGLIGLYGDLIVYDFQTGSAVEVFRVGNTGELTGDHIQDVGATDSPTFNNLTLSGSFNSSSVTNSSGFLDLSGYNGVRIFANSQLVALALSNSFYPGSDNTKTLGSATNRWSTGYFATEVQSPKIENPNASLTLRGLNGNVDIRNLEGVVGNSVSLALRNSDGTAITQIDGMGVFRGYTSATLRTSVGSNSLHLHGAGLVVNISSGEVAYGAANFSGTHIQNVGATDSPVFNWVEAKDFILDTKTVADGLLHDLDLRADFRGTSGQVKLGGRARFGMEQPYRNNAETYSYFSVTTVANAVESEKLRIASDGGLTGPHIQNLGTTDSPTFAGITNTGLSYTNNTLDGNRIGKLVVDYWKDGNPSISGASSTIGLDSDLILFGNNGQKKIGCESTYPYSMLFQHGRDGESIVFQTNNGGTIQDSLIIGSDGSLYTEGNIVIDGAITASPGGNAGEGKFIVGGNNTRPLIYLGPGSDADEFRILSSTNWIIGTTASKGVSLQTGGVSFLTSDLSQNISGPHVQNVGTTDAPMFAGASFPSSVVGEELLIDDGALHLTRSVGGISASLRRNTIGTTHAVGFDINGNASSPLTISQAGQTCAIFSANAFYEPDKAGFLNVRNIKTTTIQGPANAGITIESDDQTNGTSGVVLNRTARAASSSTLPVASFRYAGSEVAKVTTDGSWVGSHIQNVGTTDSPTFSTLTVSRLQGPTTKLVLGQASTQEIQLEGLSINGRFPILRKSTSMSNTAEPFGADIGFGSGHNEIGMWFNTRSKNTSSFVFNRTVNLSSGDLFDIREYGTSRLKIDGSGNITGTHIQNVGSSDSPTFNGATLTSLNVGDFTFSGSRIRKNQSTSDDFVIENYYNAGKLTIRSLATNAPNGQGVIELLSGGTAKFYTDYTGTYIRAGVNQTLGILRLLDDSGAEQLRVANNGNLTGTHVQNLGRYDSPAFSNLTVSPQFTQGILEVKGFSRLHGNTGGNFGGSATAGGVILGIYGDNDSGNQCGLHIQAGQAGGSGYVASFRNRANDNAFQIAPDGGLTGPHIQNLGTADSPTFAGGITTNGRLNLGHASHYIEKDGSDNVYAAFENHKFIQPGNLDIATFGDQVDIHTVFNCVGSTSYEGSVFKVDMLGNITGVHAQNLGTQDSPEFKSTKIHVKAGDPTTTDIPEGTSAIYKNSSSGQIRTFVNDGGTMYKSAAFVVA